MPLRDKVVWFVGIPVIWLILALSVRAIYENPLRPLFDLWLATAVGSWLLHRSYNGWAIKWRWLVVVVWFLLVIAAAGQRANAA